MLGGDDLYHASEEGEEPYFHDSIAGSVPLLSGIVWIHIAVNLGGGGGKQEFNQRSTNAFTSAKCILDMGSQGKPSYPLLQKLEKSRKLFQPCCLLLSLTRYSEITLSKNTNFHCSVLPVCCGKIMLFLGEKHREPQNSLFDFYFLTFFTCSVLLYKKNPNEISMF